MEMIIAASVTLRSTPQGRWGACAGLPTTRAAKSSVTARDEQEQTEFEKEEQARLEK
jgi:hypothetical protein